MGVVNDEPASGGRLFIFVALENGYLWLAWTWPRCSGVAQCSE